MRFEVADVIGNVKYIRNGDYGPKRRGLFSSPPPNFFSGGGGGETDHPSLPPTQ